MKTFLKIILCLVFTLISFETQIVSAQVWEVLPKSVRILGYRNVTTSKVNSNYNQFGSERPLGVQVKVDAKALDQTPIFGGVLKENLPTDTYNELVVGQYQVDASAQFNVHGMGIGYGITDKIMFYVEASYYNARVEAKLTRNQGNTYAQVAEKLEEDSANILNSTITANLRSMIDADEEVVQSFLTNHYGYEPLGDWNGSDFGDVETGLMIKVLDHDYWGLLLYPGVVLPTGREDDPDILQDVAFGDGQYDYFFEMASGYSFNDKISLGSTFRYTYQAPTTKNLRIPEHPYFSLSEKKGDFEVKYGDKLNWMINSTYNFSDWIAFTPSYRYIYQAKSQYSSPYANANGYLSNESNKTEHQVQLTTSLSSIKPFLDKKFALPSQININLVKSIAGKNTSKVDRFEVELRIMF